MKVIQSGTEETYEDFYPSSYEFKLCGGSVEPKDRTDAQADKDADAGAKAKQPA